MTPTRRALSALPGVLLTAGLSPSEESTAFIQSIYAKGTAEAADLTPELAHLFADDWRRGESRRLRFDWLFGGEGPPQIEDLRVYTLNTSGWSSAAVEAMFRNHGRECARRFLLVREGKHWVIEDVHLHPEDLDLSRVLKGAS
jgi:hypothetical protein